MENSPKVIKSRARFVVLFLLYIGLFSLPWLIDLRLAEASGFDAYNAYVARIAAFFYNLFSDDKAVVNGATILSGGSSVVIKAGCNGLFMALIFCSAVAAFPATLRQKLYGVGIGTALILLFNLLRVEALFFVYKEFPQYFHTTHVVAAQFVGIMFAIFLWMIWLNEMEKV